MRLTSFGLKGILAYQDSEVRVTATDLPSGLIAVRGPNGHGKSTLLETPMAAVFRSFPSRPDRAVMDYAFTSDAYLESAFDLDGRGSFRVRFSVDGPKRKTSAVLVFVAADGTETPLNDGKVSTFDQAIAQLLPPQELLLASVFGVQTQRGSFIHLGVTERKQLFAQLLGLKHLEEMADRAKKAERACSEALVPLRSARAVLARDASPDMEQELDRLANALQVEGGTLELRRTELRQELAAIASVLDGLQAAASAHASAQTKADALEADVQVLTRDHDETRAALDRLVVDTAAERSSLKSATAAAIGAIDKLVTTTAELERELLRITQDLAAARKDAETRLANNRKLLDQQEAVEAAAAAVAQAQLALEQLRQQEQQLRASLDTARQRERVLADSLATIAQRERDLERAHTAAGLLTRVPFGDDCAPCQFMVDAVAAKQQIAGLEEACAARPFAERERADVMASIATLQQELAGVVASFTQHHQTIAAQSPLAKNLADLQSAKDRIALYEARLQELEADAEQRRQAAHDRESARVTDLRTRRWERENQLKNDLAALDQRTSARGAELEARATRLLQSLTERSAALTALREQLASTADAANQAAAQRTLLTDRQAAWDESTGALASVASRRQDLDRRRALYIARRAELDSTDVRIAALQQHLVEWQTLARACSRDGLQTIEIDEAGPTVSDYTNRILRACYGTRFTVEIVTQEAKVSKGRDGSTTRETFELKVYDSERGGGARDISDLSGGEKVIVDEALKSAIALLVNDRNVNPIRTCWRDETTGPLDDDNRDRYMAMLRQVHELGAFHQTYFVTHDEDAARQADAQLVVESGAVTVQRPPYGAAA